MPALQTLSTQKQSPKWTFRGKSGGGESKSTTPGPGAYNSIAPDGSSKFKKASRTLFGSSQRDANRSTAGPGPGQYTPAFDNLKSLSPRFGFGTSVRAASARYATPGPGAYDPSSAVANESRPKYSMRIRTGASDKKGASPGPGAYSVPTVTHGAFGGSSKAVQQASPKWGFGTAARSTSNPGKGTPGPGTYDGQKSGNARAPAYTIRSRYADLSSRTQTPGPGAHGDVYTQFN